MEKSCNFTLEKNLFFEILHFDVNTDKILKLLRLQLILLINPKNILLWIT